MKSFGVVVLSFNHPEITAKCVDSVLNLTRTLGSHIPIHLVHNGSLTQHRNVLLSRYPQIEHHILESNQGFSGGANFGLSHAFKIHDQVLFLTNDTELLRLPDFVRPGLSSVKCFRRNSLDKIDYISGRLNPKSGKLSHIKTESELNTANYIPGTAFWMDIATFEKLNGFDETFHTYWEDVDLSWRAEKNNISLNYSDQTWVKHKIGKTCHQDDFYTFYLYHRNRKKFMKKHGLTRSLFWFHFYRDIILMSKNRWKLLWRIIHD